MANLNFIDANYLCSTLTEIKHCYGGIHRIKTLFSYDEFLKLINNLYNEREETIAYLVGLNKRYKNKVVNSAIKDYEYYVHVMGELIIEELGFVEHNMKINFTIEDYSYVQTYIIELLIKMYEILNRGVWDDY